jgi:Xaa-Pro aminopeptidase
VSFTPLTEALPLLRAVKDEQEISRLGAAAAAADAVYREITGLPFAGRREHEVAADLVRLLRSYGHDRADVTHVRSGPSGADPRHATGDRLIVTGDLVVLDFGGFRDGYASATTRTVKVGRPDAEERAVHETVCAAQQAAFEAIGPGVSAGRVDEAARSVIEKAGYGEFFVHRTGQGIGVTGEEPPLVAAGEEQPLAPGMCFSLGPGIRLPGRFGVRVADVVCCTATGARRLNATPQDLRTVC